MAIETFKARMVELSRPMGAKLVACMQDLARVALEHETDERVVLAALHLICEAFSRALFPTLRIIAEDSDSGARAAMQLLLELKPDDLLKDED